MQASSSGAVTSCGSLRQETLRAQVSSSEDFVRVDLIVRDPKSPHQEQFGLGFQECDVKLLNLIFMSSLFLFLFMLLSPDHYVMYESSCYFSLTLLQSSDHSPHVISSRPFPKAQFIQTPCEPADDAVQT